MSSLHYHPASEAKDSKLVACYHRCRGALLSWQFWFGAVLSQFIWFPAEHYVWEKLWPFKLAAKALGL